jgi:hypothetical protein
MDNLIAIWNAGKTAAEVGVELGMTRNAVMGKVSRLRKKGVEMRTRIPGRPRAKSPPRISTAKLRTKTSVPFEPGQKPPGFVGIPFLNLEPWQCRYPYGEGSKMLFCGKRKMEESSYCPDCHSVCHGYVNEYRGRFTPAQMIAARAA